MVHLRKQARGYRFDWLNFLNDQFGISRIVLSMVCYPFISEEEYKDVRLDIVSSKDFTIFSEDLNSISRLGQKILNAFIKKKPLNSTPLMRKLWLLYDSILNRLTRRKMIRL